MAPSEKARFFVIQVEGDWVATAYIHRQRAYFHPTEGFLGDIGLIKKTAQFHYVGLVLLHDYGSGTWEIQIGSRSRAPFHGRFDMQLRFGGDDKSAAQHVLTQVLPPAVLVVPTGYPLVFVDLLHELEVPNVHHIHTGSPIIL